jgi:hypothetical protein
MSKRISDLLARRAEPLDLAGLTARGILKKDGAWYVVVKPDELPADLWARATSRSQTTEDGKVTKVKLKFEGPAGAAGK